MRLTARLFVFASSLFIALYGILPGFFKLKGNFIASFVAGRSFLQGIDPVVFYRFPLFQRLIDQRGLADGILTYVANAPSWIMADAVLAILPASVGRFLLTGVNVAALFLLVHVTSKLAGAEKRTAYLVVLTSSFALATNFQSSEPYILLTLLLVLAFYAFSINRLGACGAFLGLAFPFNPFFAIPAIFFLLSAKWRTFTYFAVVAAAILALTFVVVGESAVVYYFQRILPAYINGRIMNPFSESYQTAWSLFRRLFIYNQTLNAHPLLDSTSAYIAVTSVFKATVIVPCAYFFYKGLSLGKPGDALAAISFPIIFLSPTAAASHLFILAPAIVVLVQSALGQGQRKKATVLAVLYAVACLPNFSFLWKHIGISNPLLDYYRFAILVALYVIYLVSGRHVVPAEQRPARTAMTIAVIAAVSITLFFGDRSAQPSSPLPLKPALEGIALENADFSPGLRSGMLTYISYDSISTSLTPAGIDLGKLANRHFYRYCSDRAGTNYALETAEDGKSVSYFRTKGAQKSYEGRSVSISRDGDYGAFMTDGKICILDLDPRFISAVDTLSLLPYKMSRSTFNSSKNNEIVFLIDSLNSSYSIGSYNLFSRRLATQVLPFRASLICPDGDDVYVTQEVADTTKLWQLSPGTAPALLLSMRANIYDITVLNHILYLSSDYRRGLDFPTIYEFVRDTTPPGSR